MELCEACGAQTHGSSLYLDAASPRALRRRVFAEAFAPSDGAAVHPWTMVRRALRAYAGRPLLGDFDGGELRWRSYARVGAAASRRARELVEACGPAGGAVALCARNGPGWLVADWACALARLPSIAVDASTPPRDALARATAALAGTGLALRAAVVDGDRAAAWEAAAPSVAVLASRPPEDADADGPLYGDSDADGPLSGDSDEPPRSGLVACLLSFGSSGDPKPLWFDADAWADWGDRCPPASRRGRRALARRSTRVSCQALFAPLSHGLARRAAWSELVHGGRLGFCDARRGAFLEEIRAVAPTQLSAAPRFYALYEAAYDGHVARGLTDAAALAATRALAGRRLRLVAAGGARVPPALLDFLERCFGAVARVSNGYAMAEVPGGIARDGTPVAGVEVRIDGAADGVGEILVRTARGAIVAAADRFDRGWFRTGDVGRWVGGKLDVVDRLGAAVKLANGEFFAPSETEWLFAARCPSLDACVLLARPGDAAPRAVVLGDVTPERALAEMRDAAAAAGLPSWHAPLSCVVDAGPWDEASGVCSAHGKMRRHVVAARHPAPGAGPDAVALALAFFDARDGDAPALPAGAGWWAALGGDSVAAARLAGAWRGGGFSVADVFALDARSLRAKARGGAATAPEARDWAVEARAPVSEAAPPGKRNRHVLLLTTATGFLGPELLAAAVADDAWEAIAVLVRGDASRVPRADGRVRPFVADLSAPGLGLAPDDAKALERLSVGVVVHAAAVVDHAAPYDALEPTNVGGLGALLERFAGAAVVFASTLSVVPRADFARGWAGAGLVPPACAADLDSGYGRSKLVAEHRLAAAAAAGRVRRAAICRLGLLGPPTRDPANRGGARDWLSLLLAAVDATRAAPLGLEARGAAVAVLPVDVAARALLARAAEDAEPGVVFDHLDAARFGVPPAPLADLVAGLERPASPVARVPYAEWRRRVAEAGPPAVLALAMLPPPTATGALRLPSGARRRLRDIAARRGDPE